MAGSAGTLFPSNELNYSTFGESANGNVNLGTVPNVITETTTAHIAGTAVAKPAGGGGIVTVGIRPAFRFVVALKPLAGTAGGSAATSGGDPTVTTTSRRIVQTTQAQHHAGGGGVQLSWFFCRYAGIALETDFLGGDHYATGLSGQLILRYPFDFFPKTTAGYSKDAKDVRSGKDSKEVSGLTPTWGLAPYVILGGGGQWDGQSVGVGDIGGGLEVRFLEHWGIYTDARWVVRDSEQHYAAVRAGVAYEF
jgi:hypothetical protein